MKATLLVVWMVLSLAGAACAQSPSFIVITTETKWPDGAVSPVGYIEKVLSETAAGYVVPGPAGEYTVPKANARKISGDEAAIALMAEREKLYADLASSSAPVPATPAYAAGLSKNDLTRMLYVLREEKMISSIRRGEEMSNEEIVRLYNQAMEQRRLRGIEQAVRAQTREIQTLRQ